MSDEWAEGYAVGVAAAHSLKARAFIANSKETPVSDEWMEGYANGVAAAHSGTTRIRKVRPMEVLRPDPLGSTPPLRLSLSIVRGYPYREDDLWEAAATSDEEPRERVTFADTPDGRMNLENWVFDQLKRLQIAHSGV